MSLKTLLAALSDGEFHSGDELGEAMGVSRTAIWKQLKKVEELGSIIAQVFCARLHHSDPMNVIDLNILNSC